VEGGLPSWRGGYMMILGFYIPELNWREEEHRGFEEFPGVIDKFGGTIKEK